MNKKRDEELRQEMESDRLLHAIEEKMNTSLQKEQQMLQNTVERARRMNIVAINKHENYKKSSCEREDEAFMQKIQMVLLQNF